jgi:hypothetical protein
MFGKVIADFPHRLNRFRVHLSGWMRAGTVDFDFPFAVDMRKGLRHLASARILNTDK